MSLSIITGFISSIFKPAVDLIDELHTSQEEKMQMKAKLLEIEHEALNRAVDLETQVVNAKKDIIVAEAKGESWMQRNWRPTLMLVIVAIVANNYLLAPYIGLFFPDKVLTLDLPGELFNLMSIGVGGYVVGRSGEKIVNKWKKGHDE